MDIAVLTFPGHLFQTTLSIRSILKWYSPITNFYVFVDDIAAVPWNTYVGDIKSWLKHCFPDIKFRFHLYSEFDFEDCASGWWRAQLVKLLSDRVISSDRWWLIDGDVIFDNSVKIDGVTPYTRFTPGLDSVVAKLHTNYVKTLLGIERTHLQVASKYVATSPVPFRAVDRILLDGARSHVENIHQHDFLKLHLQWFRDQTIIAYEDPPTRMIMTEWELLECYRHHVQGTDFKLVDYGSGYDIYTNTSMLSDSALFRHSYKRDTGIMREWWAQQAISIPNDLWQKSCQWQIANEPHRT